MSRRHIRAETHQFLRQEGIAPYCRLPDYLETWNEYLRPPEGSARMPRAAVREKEACPSPESGVESEWAPAELVSYDEATKTGFLKVPGCPRDVYFCKGMLKGRGHRKVSVDDVRRGLTEVRWKLRARGPALADVRLKR